MAPVYSGSLPPKKKSELQEIALALRISDQGTKDDLVGRITRHLDLRQDELEDHPTFTGLYGRRKRSVQPQPLPSSRLAPEKPLSSARRSITLDPIIETTPTKDLRQVSASLKHPLSPDNNDADHALTPSVPLPPPSPAKSIVERLQQVPVQSVVRRFQHQEILESWNDLVISLRSFLSNSLNIWSVMAIIELFYVLSSIIPWQNLELSLSKGQEHTVILYYPPLVVFQTSTFWLVLLHWSLPTLIIPALIGSIISFKPALASTEDPNAGSPVGPFDPLTASIIRLAAQTSYPYSSIANKTGIVGLDVLGPHWRILSASLGLAFSFAEAIVLARVPPALIDAVVNQETYRHLPSRRAITAAEEETTDEVD